MLQEIPIVLSIVVVIGFLCDTYDVEACWYLCPIAGFSLYILIRLYMVSRIMYVSRWSRILYVNLIMVSAVDLLDSIFLFSKKVLDVPRICLFNLYRRGRFIALHLYL